ncbi:unnamed protein product [Brugia pahangi]|uniref:BACK domain-containing protein n=1 Tax=Brugia pahangi TaxID=6280 RepID=A0A0N4TJB1_BRUPA|nr:unnamed protein product [Brugia pahangi]
MVLLKTGRLPKYINLSAYDKNSVRALVGYIQNENQKNITLSFYALADLIDLSRSLLMLGLLKQLENILVKMASQKTDSLLQALIIVGSERSIYGGLNVRQKIEKIAAAKFHDIVQHRLFGHIPPIIFANIIARCDLNVEKEINAVDAAIIWIWQQEKPLINSALIFSRIRSAFLSDGDHNSIQERLKTLPNGEKMIPFIMTTLTSTFCRRCCTIKGHIDKGLVRCGIPKPSNDTTIDLHKLPLYLLLSHMLLSHASYLMILRLRLSHKRKENSEQLKKRGNFEKQNYPKEKDEKRNAKLINKNDESSKSIGSTLASESEKSSKSEKSKFIKPFREEKKKKRKTFQVINE